MFDDRIEHIRIEFEKCFDLLPHTREDICSECDSESISIHLFHLGLGGQIKMFIF